MTTDEQYDIVVYGATMPGLATVRAAMATDDRLSLLLVNPRRGWGGVGCDGGQNFWDRRFWTQDGTRRLPQGGSFRHWYDEVGQAYDTDEMRRRLQDIASEADVRDRWRVTDVAASAGDIDRLELAPLNDDGGENGPDDSRHSVSAEVFVDASETGELTKLAGVPHSVGRSDWAEDNRQMAATLMFRISDLEWDRIRCAHIDGQSVFETYQDPTTGKRLFWGGEPAIVNESSFESFSASNPRFDIKPMNAAEHRDGEFWINTLLIYDVDGTVESGPVTAAHDDRNPWSRRDAHARATAVVQSTPFELAMRSFPGFEEAALPSVDPDNRIATLLYLRETIHGGTAPFAVTRGDIALAGTGPDSGADARHHERRIGLGFYWLDNNSYAADENDPELGDAANPTYIPYEALTVPTCANLLVPGYAANISGQAWFSLRVLPNLCVLGDAAGVTAALAADDDVSPTADPVFVRRVQDELRQQGAILDKATMPVVGGVHADD